MRPRSTRIGCSSRSSAEKRKAGYQLKRKTIEVDRLSPNRPACSFGPSSVMSDVAWGATSYAQTAQPPLLRLLRGRRQVPSHSTLGWLSDFCDSLLPSGSNTRSRPFSIIRVNQDLRALLELQRPLINTVESYWRFNLPKWAAAIARPRPQLTSFRGCSVSFRRKSGPVCRD